MSTAMHKKLGEGRLALAEFHRRDWVATFEAGSEPADALLPETWRPIGEQMLVRKWDRIECREELGAWWLWLMVMSDGALHLEPLALKRFILPERVIIDVGAYEILEQGTFLKWGVREKEGARRMLRSGLSSEDAAQHWLREYLKSLKL